MRICVLIAKYDSFNSLRKQITNYVSLKFLTNLLKAQVQVTAHEHVGVGRKYSNSIPKNLHFSNESGEGAITLSHGM